MQGFGGLSVITPGIADIDVLVKSISRAADDVIDLSITKAVRNATIDGISIENGDYMAFVGGKLVSATADRTKAVFDALESADTDLCEIITLFTGINVSEEERVQLTELLQEKYEDCEIVVYEGGQDVYDFLIAVE